VSLIVATEFKKSVYYWFVNSYFMIWNEVATAPAGFGSPVVSAVFPGSPTVTQSIVTAWAGAVQPKATAATREARNVVWKRSETEAAIIDAFRHVGIEE
jgi:hypothetical protein